MTSSHPAGRRHRPELIERAITSSGIDLGPLLLHICLDAHTDIADVALGTARALADRGVEPLAISRYLWIKLEIIAHPLQVAGWLLIGSDLDRQVDR